MDQKKYGYAYQWRLGAFRISTRAATGFGLVLFVLATAPDFSWGEERGRVRPNPQKLMEQLTLRLNLTTQQKEAITPIIEDEGDKRRLLMDKLRLDLDQLEQETTGRLAKELSPDQMILFHKMLEERRSRGGEKKLPPPGERVPPRLPMDGGQSRLDQ